MDWRGPHWRQVISCSAAFREQALGLLTVQQHAELMPSAAISACEKGEIEHFFIGDDDEELSLAQLFEWAEEEFATMVAPDGPDEAAGPPLIQKQQRGWQPKVSACEKEIATLLVPGVVPGTAIGGKGKVATELEPGVTPGTAIGCKGSSGTHTDQEPNVITGALISACEKECCNSETQTELSIPAGVHLVATANADEAQAVATWWAKQQRGSEPNVITDISACEENHQAKQAMQLGGAGLQQRGLEPNVLADTTLISACEENTQCAGMQQRGLPPEELQSALGRWAEKAIEAEDQTNALISACDSELLIDVPPYISACDEESKGDKAIESGRRAEKAIETEDQTNALISACDFELLTDLQPFISACDEESKGDKAIKLFAEMPKPNFACEKGDKAENATCDSAELQEQAEHGEPGVAALAAMTARKPKRTRGKRKAMEPSGAVTLQRGFEPNVITDTTLSSICKKGEISACQKDRQAVKAMELGFVVVQQRGSAPIAPSSACEKGDKAGQAIESLTACEKGDKAEKISARAKGHQAEQLRPAWADIVDGKGRACEKDQKAESAWADIGTGAVSRRANRELMRLQAANVVLCNKLIALGIQPSIPDE